MTDFGGCATCGHKEVQHYSTCLATFSLLDSQGLCDCKRFVSQEPWAGAREAIDQLRDRLDRMECTDPSGSWTLLHAFEQALQTMAMSVHDHETIDRDSHEEPGIVHGSLCPCGTREVSHTRRYDLPRPERYDDRHEVVVDSTCAERDISGL